MEKLSNFACNFFTQYGVFFDFRGGILKPQNGIHPIQRDADNYLHIDPACCYSFGKTNGNSFEGSGIVLFTTDASYRFAVQYLIINKTAAGIQLADSLSENTFEFDGSCKVTHALGVLNDQLFHPNGDRIYTLCLYASAGKHNTFCRYRNSFTDVNEMSVLELHDILYGRRHWRSLRDTYIGNIHLGDKWVNEATGDIFEVRERVAVKGSGSKGLVNFILIGLLTESRDPRDTSHRHLTVEYSIPHHETDRFYMAEGLFDK